MKFHAPLFAALLALPAFAQTATTDGAAGAAETELSTRVGMAFFTDTSMTNLRSAAEIKAQWSTLSPEDHAGLRERCAALTGADALAGAGSIEGDTPMQQVCAAIRDF